MNRKAIAAIAAAVALFSVMGSASAYTLYSEGRNALYISGSYTDELRRLNEEMDRAVQDYPPKPEDETDKKEKTSEAGGTSEAGSTGEAVPEEAPDMAAVYTGLLGLTQEYHSETAKTGRELAFKLMDYDVCLKKLKILVGRYEVRKENAEKLAGMALTGECDAKTASAAKTEAESVYFDIKALLFDISVLKADIEEITGETLKDDFNFNGVYLITDALKIDAAVLTDWSQLTTIYFPEGMERAEFEVQDTSSQLSAAVQAYYALGSAMREYIAAEAAEKAGEKGLMLGQTTADELRMLTEASEDCFLAAAQAKAELSKALYELDAASGEGLTHGAISAEEVSVLSGTLDSESGTGLWLTVRTSEGAALRPLSYPRGTCPVDEEDDASYTYTVKYNGRKLGGTYCGNACKIPDITYKDGLNYAEVYFYRNKILVGSYRVNIFTPYGKFIGNTA